MTILEFLKQQDKNSKFTLSIDLNYVALMEIINNPNLLNTLLKEKLNRECETIEKENKKK